MASPNLLLGELVRSVRTDRGLSRETLAHDVGVSTSTILRLEVYGQVPRADTLVAISDILGISLDQMLRGVAAA